MKCPSCGNYAKGELRTFFGFSVFKFKCQFCNDIIRGNATMVFLDFLSIAVMAGYVYYLGTHNEQLFPLFGEVTFPMLGFLGLFFIRLPFVVLFLKLGRYINAR